MAKRFILVKYTHISGEYEFDGHHILTTEQTEPEAVNKEVDEFFKQFYGEDQLAEADDYGYLYNGGEVGVKRVFWNEITEEQKKVIDEVRL